MQETQEMQVQSLGQEDPLEKGMATHSTIVGWKNLRRGAWRATVHGVAELHYVHTQLCSEEGSYYVTQASPVRDYTSQHPLQLDVTM